MRPQDRLGLEYAQRFTEAYQRGSAQNVFVREEMCEDVQFPAALVGPGETDLLCGKRLYPEVGYSPQYGGMGYYFIKGDWGTNEAERAQWQELEAFWDQESTVAKFWHEAPAMVLERLPGQFGGPGMMGYPAYALLRMAGLQLDYGKLVRLGIPGLVDLLSESLDRSQDDGGKAFLQAALSSVHRLSRCLLHWKDQAASARLKTTLQALTEHAPRSFHEGLQLVLAVQTLTGTINYGRLDTVLGPLLCDDLNSGQLLWSDALDLMRNFYVILEEEIVHFDARITIGGEGRIHESAADRFAILAMEATDSLSLPMPQLTLRFSSKQNPELLTKAYDVIGHGKTFPMLYNDDVNVPAVVKAFGVDRRTAEQYVPFGCGEYVIEHQSSGTPNLIVNLAMVLELTLNHGRSLVTGQQLSPDLGGLETYHTFEDLWTSYKKLTEFFIDAGAVAQESIYQVAGRECPFSLISLLYDDCVTLQRPLYRGGVRFLGGTNETYGNVNVADSLTALKQLVYDSGKVNGAELMGALRASWKGAEPLLEVFRNCPKYGNDDELADLMVQRVHSHVCGATSVAAAKTSLHHFLVVVINNNTNTVWGKPTGATPDGRKAGDPLAPGNSATAGSDKRGLTALLNSQAKLDPSIHAGAVQNVKLSSSFPQKKPDLYHALFAGYWKQGGAQTMITVANRADLIAALEKPENYANLLVRVGGFSARFIDLDPATQKEILSRTEHVG